MYVKYNKQDDTRWVYLNGAIVAEANGNTFAIGRINHEYTTQKCVAFDIAISANTPDTNEQALDKVKRFVKKSLKNENDSRRINYSTSVVDGKQLKANLLFKLQ